MTLADNICRQLQIIYDTNDSETAYKKSIDIVQSELTYVMNETYKTVLRDVRDSMRLTVNNLERDFMEREKV